MNTQFRLTRELVNRQPERVDERGPVVLADPEPEYYDQTAATKVNNGREAAFR